MHWYAIVGNSSHTETKTNTILDGEEKKPLEWLLWKMKDNLCMVRGRTHTHTEDAVKNLVLSCFS